MYFARFTAAIFALFTAVAADRSVVVLYNLGLNVPGAGSCSDQEQEMTHAILTDSTLNSTYGYERNLLTDEDDDQDDMTESIILAEKQGERDLIFIPKSARISAPVPRTVIAKPSIARDIVGAASRMVKATTATCSVALLFLAPNKSVTLILSSIVWLVITWFRKVARLC